MDMMNEKFFEVNDNLKLDGFNPNDYAHPYDENPDESYLPYEIQRWWFNQIYPNGRIVVSKPEFDPERTTGSYVATAMVWKNKNDEKEDICISNRAVYTEASTVDAYQDCQRKAVSLALKTLGFWLTPSKVVKKPMVNPADKDLASVVEKDVVPAAVAPANDETVVEPVKPIEPPIEAPSANTEAFVATGTEAPVEEAPRRRGRKPKSETVAEAPVDTPAEPTPKEDIPEKPTVATSGMSLEDARNTVITYRNYAGRTMGDIADSNIQKDRDLLKWFATSSMAKTKYAAEAAAATVIMANEA